MIDLLEFSPKMEPIIFLVDASNAVNKEKLLLVKTKIIEIVKLMTVSYKENEADETLTYVNVLKISDKSEWMYESLVPISDFIYKDFSPKSSDRNLENAFEELNQSLSRKKLLSHENGCTLPLIIFLLNGDKIEFSNVSEGLEKLNQNIWYRKAFKFAASLGNSSDNQLFEMLIDESDNIMGLSNINRFINLKYRDAKKNYYLALDEQMDLPAISIHHHIEWWNNLELNWKIILLSNYCFNRIGWNLNDCNIECFAFQGNIEEDLIGFAVWAGGGDDFDFKENIENISYSILNFIVYETKILWCAGAKVESIEPIRKLFQLEDVQGLIYRINKMELEMKSIPKNKLTNTSDDAGLSTKGNLDDSINDDWD